MFASWQIGTTLDLYSNHILLEADSTPGRLEYVRIRRHNKTRKSRTTDRESIESTDVVFFAKVECIRERLCSSSLCSQSRH